MKLYGITSYTPEGLATNQRADLEQIASIWPLAVGMVSKYGQVKFTDQGCKITIYELDMKPESDHDMELRLRSLHDTTRWEEIVPALYWLRAGSPTLNIEKAMDIARDIIRRNSQVFEVRINQKGSQQGYYVNRTQLWYFMKEEA